MEKEDVFLGCRLSIITIVRNGIDHIEETILSVISQKQIDFEYIIIDGASTDGTLKLIEKYRENIDIIISEPDKGIYDAINKGIKLATGNLIGLIHCGDKYEKDVLALCYEKFVSSKSDIIYGNINILEVIDCFEVQHTTHIPEHFQLKKKMSIYHPSTFISKSCYYKNGLYNQKYKIAADYDLFLRNFISDSTFTYIPINLAIFRSGGLSGNTIKLTSELFAIWKAHLGFKYAIYNTLKRIVNNVYFLTRKFFISAIIGKYKYNKLKIKKYKKND